MVRISLVVALLLSAACADSTGPSAVQIDGTYDLAIIPTGTPEQARTLSGELVLANGSFTRTLVTVSNLTYPVPTVVSTVTTSGTYRLDGEAVALEPLGVTATWKGGNEIFYQADGATHIWLRDP